MKGKFRLRSPIWGIIELVDMDTPESHATIVQALRELVPYNPANGQIVIEYYGELRF